jgi:hypothetical protein
MKGNKLIFLFLAFLLPVLIFLFLRFFGKNEFAVEPLYSTTPPEVPAGCAPVSIPYHIPDSITKTLTHEKDSLTLIVFGKPDKEAITQLERVDEEFAGDAVHRKIIEQTHPQYTSLKQCIFFLKEPFDLVLVDRKGTIRGEYVTNDREEVDRLLTEIAIILKKY